MVTTGRKKFSNVGFSIAVAADPLNHFSPKAEDEKTAIKITPDTYSGVAVVVIATVDRVRSVRDPSRMPATTPRTNAVGIIRTITQNIKTPVRLRRVATMLPTLSLKTVEKPQLPCKTPQKRGAPLPSVPRSKHWPRVFPSLPSIT